MDLLSIAQTMWRHRLAILPVIIVMLIGAVYVMKVKSPVYMTSSSYILVGPPVPPTADQIRRDPALAQINSYNPYVNYGDLTSVSSVLTQTMTTDPIHGTLVREGADPRYTVGPDVAYPLGTPIVQVTGVASSAAGAISSAKVVGQELSKELDKLQAAQGTDARYFIQVQPLTPPGLVQQQFSGKLRTLIAVLALGVIMLFVVASVMTGIEERRARRAQAAVPEFQDDDFWQDPAVAGGNPQADIRTTPSDGNFSSGDAATTGNGATVGRPTTEATDLAPFARALSTARQRGR